MRSPGWATEAHGSRRRERWTIIAALTAVTYAFRVAGLLAGRRAGATATTEDSILSLIGPAVFGALIAASTFGAASGLTLDARAGGLAAAALAVALRAPVMIVVLVAVLVTAALRQVM